ncbi:hypothetical protein [Falsiroseomonas oryziterrae]|uniref:hypothetical protein n=1 Tax=Falsiroseomonas oryziterrae TaxID=2911368 RepID=UPI001F3E4391|nr:hypothetical protein [Roseomonas sp. NPKOSM-4]
MTTTTTITDGAAMARLLAWLSLVYPVGAFSYSHALEAAVEEGAVTQRCAAQARSMHRCWRWRGARRMPATMWHWTR